MKKIAAFAMLVLAAALTFTACSAEKSEKKNRAKEGFYCRDHLSAV